MLVLLLMILSLPRRLCLWLVLFFGGFFVSRITLRPLSHWREYSWRVLVRTLAANTHANAPSHWRERKMHVVCMLLPVYIALKSFSTK